jgi:hypothetical protein
MKRLVHVEIEMSGDVAYEINVFLSEEQIIFVVNGNRQYGRDCYAISGCKYHVFDLVGELTKGLSGFIVNYREEP